MHKRAKVIVIVLISPLVLSVAAYESRAWLRGSVVPAYAKLLYKNGVDKNFANDFTPLTSKLRALGFTLAPSFQDECYKDANASFEGFSESVLCLKQQQSNPFVLNASFISNWQKQSSKFEQYLEANGWHKIYNAKQSISGLFSVPSYDESVGVNYLKTHGKDYCTLALSYTAPQPNPNKVFAAESCERTVSLFGGASG